MRNLFTDAETFGDEFLSRSKMFFGSDGFNAVSSAKVAVFGVGGVGGWCVESLVRTGVGHLLIVDPDTVAPSNANRQIMADVQSVGELKVEVLKKRLLAINPFLDIEARAHRYTADNADSFELGKFDCVIDAIDSLDDKMDLILRTTAETRPALFSSMGAAFRTDALAVQKSEFWKVEADALARALRSRFRKEGRMPGKKFQCVYSKEPARKNNAGVAQPRAYASICHVTAVFGFALASLAIDEIVRRSAEKSKE